MSGTDFYRSAIISIHALLAESDFLTRMTPTTYGAFLSTLSLRRATTGFDSGTMVPAISIHALLAESDGGIIWGDFVGRRFLSTISLRRATKIRTTNHETFKHFYPRSPCGERHDTYVIMEATKIISIHALLAESDMDRR